MNTMKLKINNPDLASLCGVGQGECIDVKCHQGVPLQQEWRNRLTDAKIDNCVEVVKPTTKKAAQEAKK